MPSKLNFQAKEWLPPGGLSKQFRSTPGEQDEAAYGGTAQISQDEATVAHRIFLLTPWIHLELNRVILVLVMEILSSLGACLPIVISLVTLMNCNLKKFSTPTIRRNVLARVLPPKHRLLDLLHYHPQLLRLIHTCASLMKQTERLSLALEAKRGELSSRSEKEIENEKEEPTVTTHVETETSAAASGAFGKVFQVRKTGTGEIFAMKVMKKDRIGEESGEYVRAERNALTSVVHPYIVTLRYSFQTKKKLYLVLDFINGGHLFFQLYRAGTFDEDLARLYTAELVSAISHLHSLGFVHRDLKPENVLLDAQGHVKVTDFGLAKGNMSDAEHHRTNSFWNHGIYGSRSDSRKRPRQGCGLVEHGYPFV
eukprot:jgi/Picre1/31607/NNA_006959.t1